MKITDSSLIFCLALIGFSSVSGSIAEELVVPAESLFQIGNGDFENGYLDQPAEWKWWSRSGEGTVSWVDDIAHDGGHSVRLEHVGPLDWSYSSIARLPVKSAGSYRISCWAKVQTGRVALGAVALRNGKVMSWNIGSRSIRETTQWERVEAVVDVPEGCDAFYVRFTGRGAMLSWVDDIEIEPYERSKHALEPKPRVQGGALQRVSEPHGRAVLARRTQEGDVYVGWRLFQRDSQDVMFDLYRQIDGGAPVKINKAPIVNTTDFVDTSSPKGKRIAYYICSIVDGDVGPPSHAAIVSDERELSPYVRIPLQGKYSVQKVGIADLNGDGQSDFVIKQPNSNVDPYYRFWKRSTDTYKLEAYDSDGSFKWRYDLGWSIECGVWYSPYVVYDFNGDGKAEIAVKTGEGDPRDEDGRVRDGPEYLTILDGVTGQSITQTDWPSRSLFEDNSDPYNYSSRNQLGVAYLDGKTPCLIVERGTYGVIVVEAYELRGTSLRKLWRWDNLELPRSYYGQGAHGLHVADVDSDGRDEVIIGSAVIDDNGDSLWTTGLGHPDHVYLGDLDPAHPGLEIYYGMETRQPERNGMCMVDAATGNILWGHPGPTRHVHGRGMGSDIDARSAGAEFYSVDTDADKKADRAFLRTAQGTVISDSLSWSFGPFALYWDGDPQREVFWKKSIQNDAGEVLQSQIKGHVLAVADLLGDWREELIVGVPGEIRIYSTTLTSVDRRPWLMEDPIYRMDVAHASMGYFQVPMLSYDLASQSSSQVTEQ
jgi:rhamnogalacturonan endolyase